MKQKRFFYALHFPIILQMELDFGRGYCKNRALLIYRSPKWKDCGTGMLSFCVYSLNLTVLRVITISVFEETHLKNH